MVAPHRWCKLSKELVYYDTLLSQRYESQESVYHMREIIIIVVSTQIKVALIYGRARSGAAQILEASVETAQRKRGSIFM